MSNDKKITLIVNLVPVIVAVFRGIPGALDLLSKMGDALKDGASPEELETASLELEAALTELIASTEATTTTEG